MKPHPIGIFLKETPDKARRWGCFFLVIISMFGVFFIIKEYPDHTIYQRDFLAIYVLPNAIAYGGNISSNIDDLANIYVGKLPKTYFNYPTHHPPTLGILLFPLAFLNYFIAQRVWYIMELIFFIFSIRFLLKAVELNLPFKWLILLSLALLGFYPVNEDLSLGQIHCLLLFLLAAMWLSLKKNRVIMAGILWGLSLLLKQLTWPLLIVLLYHKKYKTICWGAFTVALGYLLVGFWIGFSQIYNYFFVTLPPMYEYHVGNPCNLSFFVIGKRLFEGAIFESTYKLNFYLNPVFSKFMFHSLFAFILPGGLLIYALHIIKKTNDLDSAFCLFCGFIMVLNPLVFNYFFTFSLIPSALVLRKLINKGFPMYETNLALFSFFLVALEFSVWFQIANMIEVGGFITYERYTNFTFHYLPHLLFFMPAIGSIILSFLAARPVEIPQRSVEKPTREE